MSSLKATSWLDHWLSAFGKMIDGEKQPEVMEMLVSGGKSLRYVCQQEMALWTEILLKRRDAALSNPVPLAEDEKSKLRNSPIFSSDFLFSPDIIGEIGKERKGRRQENFMDSVVSLAKSSSSRKSAPGAKPRKAKKKKRLQRGNQQQQTQEPQPGTSAEPQPFQGNNPKAPAKSQGFSGKSRGRGCGRDRN